MDKIINNDIDEIKYIRRHKDFVIKAINLYVQKYGENSLFEALL